MFTDSFYNSNINLKKWNGFNVFAVDGTSLQVPDTLENIEYFVTSTNQSTTKTAFASASALYDVLNDIVIDATISRYRTSERKMVIQHINSLNNIKLLSNSIIIFDRGYPSYDTFNFWKKMVYYF